MHEVRVSLGAHFLQCLFDGQNQGAFRTRQLSPTRCYTTDAPSAVFHTKEGAKPTELVDSLQLGITPVTTHCHTALAAYMHEKAHSGISIAASACSDWDLYSPSFVATNGHAWSRHPPTQVLYRRAALHLRTKRQDDPQHVQPLQAVGRCRMRGARSNT